MIAFGATPVRTSLPGSTFAPLELKTISDGTTWGLVAPIIFSCAWGAASCAKAMFVTVKAPRKAIARIVFDSMINSEIMDYLGPGKKETNGGRPNWPTSFLH
ncbi:hypothetical protein BE61_87750 [Bradyrhizobium elkanii USDA 61]|nr:hypothetical protein BE61_87750 [Bradyrhizobium elkanii USDA 61]